MSRLFSAAIRPLIRKCGVDVVRYRPQPYPQDFDAEKIEIYRAVEPYTITSPERVNAVIEAVKYLSANKIEGAFVECGVWKGGSTMAMCLTLNLLGDVSREVYLYDTFSGMSEPTEVDVSIRGENAPEKFSRHNTAKDVNFWGISALEEVKLNISRTGYPKERIHFIQGKVEDTIPATIPKNIALLRLDTDWYESTKHELHHLFPLLMTNGVLLIDDYGHWAGARKAVDEYIAEQKLCILLNRIDYTGRIAIKASR